MKSIFGTAAAALKSKQKPPQQPVKPPAVVQDEAERAFQELQSAKQTFQSESDQFKRTQQHGFFNQTNTTQASMPQTHG
jgi:hypothetical protein